MAAAPQLPLEGLPKPAPKPVLVPDAYMPPEQLPLEQAPTTNRTADELVKTANAIGKRMFADFSDVDPSKVWDGVSRGEDITKPPTRKEKTHAHQCVVAAREKLRKADILNDDVSAAHLQEVPKP